MAKSSKPTPRTYSGVTISSTFTDLKEHRTIVLSALTKHHFVPIAMEHDAAKLIDVIDSSLQMVENGAAYIGIISMKYGQTPTCPIRNPDNLSITELEFNKALELGRPVLLFIMGEDHLLKKSDIEKDDLKEQKLNSFRERAKKMSPISEVHRVYAVFNSLEEFKEKVNTSLLELENALKISSHIEVTDDPAAVVAETDPIPKAPDFYAEPQYIGSHNFVGRKAELDTLNDWARPAAQQSVLLFDAIGGNGKSMLTWEWTINYAKNVRKDWAGIFWYSFYEKGAIMADFCRRALAYTTGKPLENFRKKKTRELKEQLLHQLKDKPWLFILDGLERVLVAYHRIDATEIPDEELDTPTDKIIRRDPSACINDEDDELLRSLAAAVPSKILVSTRLVPRVLFNQANQPIPGVQRVVLTGLRPVDAELLFHSCGINGDSELIQNYLTTNCDCHPLTIGVLAGLVNNYLPDKGNFDAWVTDVAYGASLNLAELDLVQRRNHILKAALHSLPTNSSQLLLTLALLPESVDYSTLSVFNPHIPPEPELVLEPTNPKEIRGWQEMNKEERDGLTSLYEEDTREWNTYKQNVKNRLKSKEYLNAQKELDKTVKDLEVRGLLQYDNNSKRYDLHPVVRGVVAGGLKIEERQKYGQRVIDHFSSQAHNPYRQAENIEDVQNGINIVKSLIKMKRYNEAYNNYSGELSTALMFNLEAYQEVLSIVKPFFLNGWGTLPLDISQIGGIILANYAGISLTNIGELEVGVSVYSSLIPYMIDSQSLDNLIRILNNIIDNLINQNHFATVEKLLNFTKLLVKIIGRKDHIFIIGMHEFFFLSHLGKRAEAEKVWDFINPMGRKWNRSLYRLGDAEYCFAVHKFWVNDLKENNLSNLLKLAEEDMNRIVIRKQFALKGAWYIEQKEWQLAMESLSDAVKMARRVSASDIDSEIWLVLAKYHLGQLTDSISEAEYLSSINKSSFRPLAELWLAVGDKEQAKKYAIEAYKRAWADGEPYTHKYELDKSIVLLNRLSVKIPNLPLYDSSKEIKFEWEDKLIALIEKLEAEKSAESSDL